MSLPASAEVEQESAVADAPAPEPVGAVPAAARALGMAMVGTAGLGILLGVLWRAIVKLPEYRLDEGNHAVIAERGLTAIFTIDAWYAGWGLAGGLLIGLAAWRFFRPWGWKLVLVTVAATAIAALTCWAVGTALGPGPLQDRLAVARPGNAVPVDFHLHAYSTLAVWFFGAMVPLLAFGTLARDPDFEPRQRRLMPYGGHDRVE